VDKIGDAADAAADPRKNCWTIAGHAGRRVAGRDAALPGPGRRDADAVRDVICGYVTSHLSTSPGPASTDGKPPPDNEDHDLQLEYQALPIGNT